ncbi:hypothetical protein J3F81_002666 [Coemansia sp. RSA 371]|nr:hypothetical protein J3F81_002666 [Coemansia sp. RSA 371]
MARITVSIVATAWLLAATQVAAGPIAAAGEPAASSEPASLGGLLQALGADAIGNGEALYPTGASSHQREESEIMASDTMTRVLKKVKSILKEGGINDNEDDEDESESVTYLIKPAMIYHKEELPANGLPLPGGALMNTPTPTAPNSNEATTGPAASIKDAHGNLFAASPYTPSYTLAKPHAAVIVEEITDMVSLKSSLQRLEDKGVDVDDESDSEDEDDYGQKRKKSIEIVSLETIDSTSAVVNPFTQADFPLGLMTPPMPATPTPTPTNSRKTIKKTVSAKTSDQIRASIGKDGGITVVNNAVPSATAQGSTIVIPASFLQSLSTHAPKSSSAAPESSAHEESKSEEKGNDLKANKATRMAHKHSTAQATNSGNTQATGLRDEATFDPLKATSLDPLMATSAISTLASLASETALSVSPTVTVGSTDEHLESATDSSKRRKMRIVRVYEVKKSKGASATAESTGVHKRDMMPVFDVEPTPTENSVRVGNVERADDEADDSEDDEDVEETTVDVAAESDDSDVPMSDMESDMPMSDELMADADKQSEASSTEANVAKTEVELNTSSKSMSIETIGAVSPKDEQLATATNEPASTTNVSRSSKSDSGSDSDSDNASGKADSDSDSDSDNESEGAKDSDDESDDDEEENKKENDDEMNTQAQARVAVINRDNSMGAIQRVAALGLREAEKAIEDIELNSDASDIEIQSDDVDMVTATSPLLSPISASGFKRVVETPNHSVDSSAHNRSIETPAHKRAVDDDDDDDDEDDTPDSPAKEEEDSDDDSDDSDDSDDKSADADSDSDSDSNSDSDTESSSSRAKSATSQMKPRETMSVGTEEDDARKALSEAAAESTQQAVGVDAMASESAMSMGEEGSADARNANEGDENATEMSDMDNMSDNASDEDFEFETEAGINSEGEDVEFVTQLEPESERKNIHETPKVAMGSADEDDEDAFTNVKSDNIEDDEPVMRGVEPTPDVRIKESQNRAMNIGLGNLRRRA